MADLPTNDQRSLLRSNYGKGPLVARIVSDDGEIVHLERWDERAEHPHIQSFDLKRSFMASKACGWRVFDTGEGKV